MHLMMDLETLGIKPSTVVLSAGLVLFDPKKGIIDKMEASLDIQEQIDSGRTICESTLKWWLSQGAKAKEVFEAEDKVDLEEFFAVLESFLEENEVKMKDLKVWGNGPSFDVVILEDMLRKLGGEPPWKFWNVCCFRTFDRITRCKQKHKRKGTHHNALDDAIYQAECVIKARGGKV